jgi:uncharacterized LabA/DUF88 family protein
MTTAKVPVAAYIDGFNLYNGMHEARGRRGLWLDMESMLRSLLRPPEDLVAVHYFTAPVNGPGQARQQAYLDALNAHCSLTEIHVGRFQRKSVRCRRCSQSFDVYEEKHSDVSFGVQIAEDAALGRFEQALLVSGDSDMLPAVQAVRRIRPTARLVAVFPPRRSSYDLRQTADATLNIWDRVPERHQLPNPVYTVAGTAIHRPSHWT